jgi:adenylate kinase family enzyme
MLLNQQSKCSTRQLNFQVHQPESFKLDLDGLFYPDYGLATASRRDSIAVTLQRLREHAGYGPVGGDPLYSLILYGPPGTGKTTLVEAVAKTAKVPLVEITPSDILVGGAEGMERRVRQVFQMLSKLTHVVILFDEFDSILLDRAKRDPERIPTSVIEFLTPGMLPKLKALNSASKTGRMSYVLATNFLDRIDSAVRRSGRFDEKVGIYPPDVISRLGRLLDKLHSWTQEHDHKIKEVKARLDDTTDGALKRSLQHELEELDKTKDGVRKRTLEAATATRSGAMEKLVKSYSMPGNEAKRKGTLFGYILEDDDKNDPLKIEREADYRKDSGREKRVRLATSIYWQEWKCTDDWDRKIEDHTTGFADWAEVSKFLDDVIEVSKPVLDKAKAAT